MVTAVICLGECLIDRIFHRYNHNHPSSPFWVDYPGGAPANVAVGLARLGTPVRFIGCLGRDRAGDGLLSALQAAGVNCVGVQRSTRWPTRVVLVRRDQSGERCFVGFSQPDLEAVADAHLQVQALQADWFKAANYLVMGTLGLAYGPVRETMEQALAWAQQYALTTVIDVNWRPAFWPQPSLADPLIRAWLQRVDILKLNHTEARWLFQSGDPKVILNQLEQARAVLVTAGAEGCNYATATLQGHIPAFSVECEDSTGAGDSFLAGFIHQLCLQGPDLINQGDALRTALRYACAAGALTTTLPGAMAAQPDASTLQAFLYLHPAPSP
ncbi:MAG: carbohydrate kinase [Cyanobacteria bacterium REEB459]|nr:carbohydrate kinase [Cyanobacteria bacterium REEB459]